MLQLGAWPAIPVSSMQLPLLSRAPTMKLPAAVFPLLRCTVTV
jgi:hypothetical protein